MESTEKFEAGAALLQTMNHLRHAQGNAVAFILKGELAESDDERRDCEGCVLYWDRIADQYKARITELNAIINHHD